MEQKPEAQVKQQPQQISKLSEQSSSVVDSYYRSLAKVKMTFKMHQVHILKLDKFQLVLPPQTKLLQVKRIIDQISKKNFNIYVKDSFMPNLNSKIGDLAQCYARYDDRQKIHQINFSISERKDFYG